MKKIMLVFIPLFFILIAIIVGCTYALFESTRVNTSMIDIAKWQVKINGDNIDGSSDTFTVNSFVWSTSTKVKSGKAAPGLSGYFEIVLDPNNTDTSIRYDLTFDFSNLDEDQFRVDRIIEINDKTIYRTGESTYSNIITLDEIRNNETNTIRVYLEWIEDEANNEKDSALVLEEQDLTIPVRVDITQYIDGDEIVEYTPGG